MSTAPTTPEKYLVAFVIQGDTMFKITADSIIQATGGAAGLGRSIVARFIAEGANVAVLDRNVAGLDRLVDVFGERVVTVVNLTKIAKTLGF